MTLQAEKENSPIHHCIVFWLSDHTLIILRNGLLIQISNWKKGCMVWTNVRSSILIILMAEAL